MKLFRNFAGWLLLGVLLLGLNSYKTTPTAASSFAIFSSDTVTYSDERIVYKLPTDTSRNSAGDLRRIPDLSAAPAGARYRVLRSPTGDSVMVVTGDTFALSPMDSSTASLVANNWGVLDPHSITLAWHTPSGDGGGQLASGDLGTVYGMTVQDSENVATLVGFGYLDFPVDSTTIPLLGNESGELWWNFEKWADLLYDHLHEDAVNGFAAIFDHQHWDRTNSLYAYWWMTGKDRFKRQADSTLWMAFQEYYEPNECHIPPQRMLPEGMWSYYFTHRGHTDSAAVADTMLWCNRRIAERLRSIWIDDYNDPTNPYDDSRIQARTAHWAGTMALFDSTNYAGQNWQALGPALMYDSLMSFHELKATNTTGVFHLESYCETSPHGVPFWIVHASPNYVMMRGDTYFGLDATQLDSLQKVAKGSADSLINAGLDNHDNFTSTRGPRYQYGPCEGTEGLPALNILTASPYAWTFKETGDSLYWDFAVDSLIAEDLEYGNYCGGSEGPCNNGDRNWWYSSGSEFNQAYYNIWKILILLDSG